MITITQRGYAALIAFIYVSLTIVSRGHAACENEECSTANTSFGVQTLNQINGGIGNSGFGFRALFSDLSGGSNTAFGDSALIENKSGNNNTAVGFQALFNNDNNGSGNASFNTAVGESALYGNISGDRNTAVGDGAMIASTTGYQNTAVGVSALRNNTSGHLNVAVGQDACSNNQTATSNTGVGYQALMNNSVSNNTALGYQGLLSNSSGTNNTATGYGALFSNTTAGNNTANGASALVKNTTGAKNMAAGVGALQNNTTGGSNVAIGYLAGQSLTAGSNNIDIGANVTGSSGEANTIRIGKSGTQTKAFIAGISGKTVASGVGVIINSSGQLGTVQSSARYKDDIKPMDKASETILALKPVTFRYKEELDPDHIPQFGLIAEEVEKIDPGLVVRDEEGKVMTIRYEAINAMLLNEFLKEHQKVVKLEATLADERKRTQEQAIQQQKRIEGLAAGVQEVRAQLAALRDASETN